MTEKLPELMTRAGIKRVLALCPDREQPVGGVRKIYRHVDVLNANQIPAVVVHEKRGFRCNWFEHQTPVIYLEDVGTPRHNEILLVPELLSWQYMVNTPGVPKVIFNQNVYMLFKNSTSLIQNLVAPYNHPDFLATLVVSDDSRRYINYGFPGHPVFRLHCGLDLQLFYCREPKRRQIALMPRKKGEDAAQILNLLAQRGTLEGFDIIQIHDMSESQAARILGEAQVFLSLGTYEGFGLPALEAMACECIVVGYHGRGGAEFMNENWAFPIEAEDVVGFAQTLEQILIGLRTDPAPLLEKARRASEFVRSTYTPQREEQDILAAWGNIFQIGARIKAS